MKCSRTAFTKTAALACCFMLAGCGAGRGPSNVNSSSNVQPIVISGGPNNYANGLFTTVTICAPGTSNCQSIPNVLVDTGSFGLRLLSSAVGTLVNSLPEQTDSGGDAIYECAQFVDSVVWGSLRSSDVVIGQEQASKVPIEVIDATSVPVPAACQNIGPAEEDLSTLGANGILGIGFFIADCGNACAATDSSNPGFYYACAGSSCKVAAEPETGQVKNPVALFTNDNNGVVVQLPAATGSAATLNGSLAFGIGTRSNNALGSAHIFTPDKFGNLVTTFKNNQYSGFLDTGSNAYFFLNSKETGISNCGSVEAGFYCPASPVSLVAINSSPQGGSATAQVSFTIDSASRLFSNSTDFVFPTLAGPSPDIFDWGLPFFIGRTVFVALEGRATPAGQGPYWAY